MFAYVYLPVLPCFDLHCGDGHSDRAIAFKNNIHEPLKNKAYNPYDSPTLPLSWRLINTTNVSKSTLPPSSGRLSDVFLSISLTTLCPY